MYMHALQNHNYIAHYIAVRISHDNIIGCFGAFFIPTSSSIIFKVFLFCNYEAGSPHLACSFAIRLLAST